jgi:uncharacterized protein YfaS (alpha-2-macroglobulin family)
LSEEKYLVKDPEGLPDFTLPVAIVAELIPSLAVDITAQSIGNLKVDIAAQSLTTLNVNVTGSQITLNVSVTSPVDTSGNLKVAVQSSVTINVNIASQSVTLNVNISSTSVTIPVSIQSQAVTLNVNLVGSSITLNVSITSPTDAAGNLRVAVQSSVTINVSIVSATATLNVNISAQSVTLNINVVDFKSTITPTALLEKGTQQLVASSFSASDVVLYTTPSGKTAYVIVVSYYARNTDTAYSRYFYIYAVVGGVAKQLIFHLLAPGDIRNHAITGGVVKLPAGSQLKAYAETNVTALVCAVIIEV